MSVQNDKGSQGGGSLLTDLANTPAGTPAPAATDVKVDPAAPPAPAQDIPPTPAQPEPDKTTKAGELPAWTTSASKTIRADPRFAAYASKFNSLDETLLDSISLNEKVAKMVAVPDEHSSDEDKAAFKKALNIPATPEAYKLEIDPKYGVDEEQIAEYRKLAHSLNLTNDAANEFFKVAAEKTQSEIAAYKARTDEMKAETASALKKEWGKDYEAETQVLIRGIKAFGGDGLLDDAENTGMGNKLSFIKLLHKLGQMTKEDSALKTPGGGGAVKKSISERLYPEKQE